MPAEAVNRPPDRSVPPDRSNRPFWIAIGVLLLLLIAAFAWKVASVSRVEDRMAERERLWEEGARHALEQNTRAMLGLVAVPLGLLVRDDAMARNYGLMQERFERLVGEPGVERVLYATENDSIVVSTDRSLVGAPLSTALPQRYWLPAATNVVLEASTYQAIVPVTGLNERLGVVVLTYRGETASRDAAAPDSAARP